MVGSSPISPRVSLVVPAFNEPANVMAQSLASVSAQTLGDFECLVVDESTDPALAKACCELCGLDPRMRYLRPPSRLGLPGSLNFGIAQARGEYIARFDSDDVCEPERLALQVAFLDAHPEVHVLGGGLKIISERGKFLAVRHYPTHHDAIERKMHFTTSLAHPTVMFRRRLVADLNAVYDPTYRFAEDLDLWLRLLARGARFANLDQVLVQYRQDRTRRQRHHWQFNARARWRNFGWRHWPRRLFGLAGIGVWVCLPDALQERIFRVLLLRHDPSAEGPPR